MEAQRLSRRAWRVVSLVVAAVMAWAVTAAPALAQDIKTFEVEGQADAGASDPRSVAVDDAFAEAAKEALEDLLPKAARAEHRAVLAKEIVGRARRWVASYKVVGDETTDGRRKLAVSVRIDLEKLRIRLGELGIAEPAPEPVDPSQPGGEPGAPAGNPPSDPLGSPGDPAGPGTSAPHGDSKWAGKSAVVLLRARRGDRAVASYGASADRAAPGAAAASALLSARGVVVRAAPSSGPSPSAALDDDDARGLAKISKAELAVVVEVEVSERQLLRGVAAPMILARAAVRVLGPGEPLRGEGAALLPIGEDERQLAQAAVDRAVTAALTQALPSATRLVAGAALVGDDDDPAPVEGAVWLRVSPRTPWRVVSALLRHLGKQPSTAAELRRLSPAGILVLVTSSAGAARVAALAKATALPTGTGALKVRSDRGMVTVRVEEP